MEAVQRLIHLLAHKLGNNTGDVTTWWQGDKLMIGFRCDGCGKVSDAHECTISFPKTTPSPAPHKQPPAP